MSKTLCIHGVIPPVPTPLRRDGSVDLEAFYPIFDYLVNGGADAAFVLGSTGELASLSATQRREVIRGAVGASAGRLPVLVGIVDTCLSSSVELADRALDLGASAVVAAAPYYYELAPEELKRHFELLLQSLKLPVFLYNMPWLTGHVIDEECVRMALDHTQVIGFKDSSGDLNYLKRLIEIADSRPDVSVLVGNEALYLNALEMGADGVVGGGGNIFPEYFRKLQDAFVHGDVATASLCQERISQLGAEIFDLTGHPSSVFVAIKAAMECLGLCERWVAPPLIACNEGQMELLRRIVSTLPGSRRMERNSFMV